MKQETYDALKTIVSYVHGTSDAEGVLRSELSQVEDWIDEVAKEYNYSWNYLNLTASVANTPGYPAPHALRRFVLSVRDGIGTKRESPFELGALLSLFGIMMSKRTGRL